MVAQARRLAAPAAEPVIEMARRDGGLLAGHAPVAFEAPVRGGDVLEATGELVRVGIRSREVESTMRPLYRAAPGRPGRPRTCRPEPVVVVRRAVRRGPLTG